MQGGLGFLFPLIIIGGMMFFMTRSQKKQQNQRQELLNSMKLGDEVVTIGGLYGVVHELNTDKGTVTIDCEGIYLVFERAAIKTVTPAAASAPAATVETEEVTEVVETKEEEKENQ
ncbi:preprotein translocase subunit YajC [Vagococcus hydrophili]|uniref:Preprotein translocase subunit YajC n=1 Tax=Vagococcus hydrophili TaxID=2714947 RepID=A0A6G8ARV4_9ENTE|nr:preprotein translocase subunit YajC [Vagococcus hydrophili]QIL47720.1 preprotein translocase subunit YajC [Vagococcus hydrophili]